MEAGDKIWLLTKRLHLPDINVLLGKMLEVTLSFDRCENTITKWLKKYRNAIKNNKKFVEIKAMTSKLFLSMLGNLLVKATRGEMGIRIINDLH